VRCHALTLWLRTAVHVAQVRLSRIIRAQDAAVLLCIEQPSAARSLARAIVKSLSWCCAIVFITAIFGAGGASLYKIF
jgi:hypothetical protein